MSRYASWAAEASNFLRAQSDVYDRQQLCQLPGRAGAGDWRHDRRLGDEPGQGDRGDRGVMRRGNVVQGGQQSEAAVIQVARGPSRSRTVDLCPGTVLAGQKALRQPVVRETAKTFATAHRT